MRFVLIASIASCALALAYPASAAPPINWHVDTSAYGSRNVSDRIESMRTTIYDYRTMNVGTLKLVPSFKITEPDGVPQLYEPLPFSKSVELGMSAYLKDHPNFRLIGKYLYHRASKNDERDFLFRRDLNHMPDVSHGHGVRLGFSCNFPLTTCFNR